MDVDFVIKNYRCFPDVEPLRFHLHSGFTGLLGTNNSGKSTVLRFFYEFRGLFDALSNVDRMPGALRGNVNFSRPSTVLDAAALFTDYNDRDISIEIALKPNDDLAILPPYIAATRYRITIERDNTVARLEVGTDDQFVPAAEPIQVGDRESASLSIGGHRLSVLPLVELFLELKRVLYIGPFRNIINVGEQQDYYDIAIGKAFVQRWRSYKSGAHRKSTEAALRMTRDIVDLFGFGSLEINAADNGETLQIILNQKSYMLNEMGSGLAQFIVVLANAALKSPPYIFIDEPELNLHPALQIQFLTTLGRYAERGVIFATHSFGLARAVSEDIYSVARIEQSRSRLAPFNSNPRLSELLGELSYAGYRQLGYRKLLLVEGSTEVKTFQQLLRLYGKDHEVVLLPLGGSDLIADDREVELRELQRIADDIAAVIDSERASQDEALMADREKFRATCERIGIQCHVLGRRATENYLTEAAIKKVKGEKYEALGMYERLKDVECGWAKSDNWKIANEMTKDDLEGTDLGGFLADI